MGSTGSNRGSSPGTSNTLCEFCDSIKFEALGFHANLGSHDGSSDGEFDKRYLKELLGGWRYFKNRDLQEILDGEEGCFFCGKVAKYFHEWRDRIFKEKDPDIQNSFVHFQFQVGKFKPKGCFIRFSVTFKVPKPSAEGGSYYSVMQFQKCSQKPVKVEDFCKGRSLFDWESGPEQAYSGRIRPLVADTRLFRKWKETCIEEHGCISSFSAERPSWLRLIDVEKRCVVDSEDYSSYTALSYVWGTGVQFSKLEKSTVDQFRQTRSLTREMLPSLPSTIDDAIEVTRGLGEKYLWADCLCIIQDDDIDKQKFIPQMDLIYGFASVTIVAASGVDVWAGLPGVKQGSRTRKEMPFMIKGVSLLQTLDPEWIDGLYSEDYRYLGDFVWCKRGWTFQEKIFSGRLLIFTEEQVYWECQKATWCEDGFWETKNFGTYYRHCFGNESNFRRPWSLDLDSFSSWGVYHRLVEEYSGRTLTHNRDGLDAFAGILSALKKEAGQHFLWALPTSFLESALTWACAMTPGKERKIERKIERRLDSCTVRISDGRIIKCHFPSWSWLGWVGKIVYDQPNWFKVNLIFYYLDDNGTLVQAPGERNDDTRTKVTREDIPESILTLSIASNILFFWSDTTELHVRHGVDKYGHKKPILSRNGKDLHHFDWYHRPVPALGHNELAEFVVIGKEGLSDLFVLLVDRKDGVAYRRGLARIHSGVWVKLDKRERKMISLG